MHLFFFLQYKLLLYLSQQKQVAAAKIHVGFVFTVSGDMKGVWYVKTNGEPEAFWDTERWRKRDMMVGSLLTYGSIFGSFLGQKSFPKMPKTLPMAPKHNGTKLLFVGWRCK